MTAYATAGEYREQIKIKGDPPADLEIERDLLSASRFIDRHCKRTFHLGPLQARVFDVRRQGVLIDDVAVVTQVRMLFPSGHTEILNDTEYSLEPLNALLETEPEPWTRIRLGRESLLSQGHWRGWDGDDRAQRYPRVEITGRFGWPEVPAGIKSSCIEFAAMYRLESPRSTGQISFTEQSGTFVSKPAQRIVDSYLQEYKRVKL